MNPQGGRTLEKDSGSHWNGRLDDDPGLVPHRRMGYGMESGMISCFTWLFQLIGDDASDKVGVGGLQVSHQSVQGFLYTRLFRES